MLEVGKKAPDFELPDQNGEMHKLSDYAGKKVILYFYPKDNTPGCTKQACGFSERYPQFTEKGAVILGVSKDSVASHKRFEEKYGLAFTLLADPERKVIEAYDVWKEKKNYGKVSINLQTQVERFYRFFRDTLKFSLPGSICDKYKMMVMVNYSLEGTAYGGTYDDFIGALWVTPNRIQDQKLNCLAHELGHSFQLQIMADKTGEAWGGSGFFEMTSQWMLWRVNPDWITDEKYHFDAFRQLTHKGYLHLDNIYHSPYVIEWWAEKHGLESIAQLYREGKVGEDPVVTYKRKYKMSQKQFNDEMFDCYRHLVNFDFGYARKETRPYACTFDTRMLKQKNGYLRPDTASVPENYGFNAIKLEIPKAGKKVTVDFRALDAEGKVFKASKDKMARTISYRYGLVGVTADTDECIYSQMGEAMNGKVSLVAPKSQPLKALYLVVMGAPANHSLDPSSRRFPYEVRVKYE